MSELYAFVEGTGLQLGQTVIDPKWSNQDKIDYPLTTQNGGQILAIHCRREWEGFFSACLCLDDGGRGMVTELRHLTENECDEAMQLGLDPNKLLTMTECVTAKSCRIRTRL